MNYKALPKIDLHRHLDGSVRVSTLRDLAIAGGFRLPTRNLRKLAPYCQVGRDCRSLSDFLRKFFFFYKFLKTPYAVERIAYETCEDAAKDGVIYHETRFAPVLQAAPGFSMKEVVESAVRGIERGQKKFRVAVRIILCCYRSESPESSVQTVELARLYRKRGVVGIDLAGDERRYPARPHYPAFQLAKKYGIPATVHAGEACGAESVREAVEKMHAVRVGHGTRSIEDERVMGLLKKRNVTLEVCPTSNVQTCSVPSLARHPLKKLDAWGVPVTVNSDDPGVSALTLSSEYAAAVHACGLKPDRLAVAVRRAAEAAFCDASTKKRIQKIVEKKWKIPGRSDR